MPAREATALVQPRAGIVRALAPFAGEPGDAPLHVVGAQLADTAPLGGDGQPAAAGGIGWTRVQAEAAALGEACERYAAALPSRDGLRWSSARDLPDAVRGWALFSQTQYRHPALHAVPWDEAAPMHWAAGRSLSTGKPAWIPAQFVYFPYALAPGEPRLAPGLTTGLAAGRSRDDACLAGLYELIERDAFTLAWLTRARPSLLPREGEPDGVARLRRHGLLRLLDITTDVGLPTCLAVLEKPSSVGNVIAIGAATRHSMREAAEKAALEAFQSFPYIREIVRADPGWRANADLSNVRDFRDHCRFYTLHPEAREGLANLVSDDLPRGRWLDTGVTGPTSHRLADAVRRASAAGIDSYAVDITPSDLAAHGVDVVRVVSPQAQPLHGSHQCAHLAGPRLLSAAQHLPFLDRTPTESEVNPWPHPFA